MYEEALRIDPTFTGARASLGIINFEFFDRAKGVELLSQALKAVDGLTDNERVSVLGFHAMVVEKNLEKAADHYKTFLTLHPDVASAHNNLGRIYMQMRRFKDAIAELQETIRLDPDLFLAYFSLNSVYLYEVADLDSAIATAQRQLARSARSARAYGQLGAAYAGQGDLRQAEGAFRKAVELDSRGLSWITIALATRSACRGGSTRRARSICTFSRSRRRRPRRTTRPGPSRS